jgi:hypothetical protein
MDVAAALKSTDLILSRNTSRATRTGQEMPCGGDVKNVSLNSTFPFWRYSDESSNYTIDLDRYHSACGMCYYFCPHGTTTGRRTFRL